MSSPSSRAARPSLHGRLAATWGLIGVVMLLLSAIGRLAPIAAEALAGPLELHHWGFLVGWVVFMGYGEGYRGFQKAFSPRVVARAVWLRDHPTPLRTLLAPALCMGLVHATRKRLIVSWAISLMVVALIMGVRHLPAPWRGLVDVGVVVGLSWGLAAIVAWTVAHLRGRPIPIPPDVPVEA